MMRKFILAIISFQFIIVGYSQNYIAYHLKIAEAKLLFYQEQYKPAIVEYKKAFNLEEGFASDKIKLAKCYTLLNNFDSAFIALDEAVLLGLQIERIQKDSLFFILKTTKQWVQFDTGYQTNHNKFLKTINLGLRKEMMDMAAEDQRLRHLGYNDSIYHIMLMSDLKHTKRMEEIMDSCNCWPGVKLIGNAYPSILLMHTQETFRKKYFSFFVKQIKKGNLQPNILAAMMDQLDVYSGNKQTYGIYIKENKKTGEIEPEPIKDIIKANKLRKEIGLPSIKVSYEIKNLIKQQKKK